MKAVAFCALLTHAPLAQVMGAWAQLDAQARAAVLEHRFNNKETALHIVARRGLQELVEPLLRAGADIDAPCALRQTPLHAALQAGQMQISLYLLDCGANIDAYTNQSTTMLHQAILAKRSDAVAWLLHHGARADAPVLETLIVEVNAYHLAAESTPDILRLMLRSRQHADSESADETLTQILRSVLSQQRADLLDVLIDYGVNINAAGPDGLTPAQFLLRHRTSMVDSVDLLRRLHEAGADLLQAVSAGGETSLMLAANACWVQAFDYLLAAGVPVDGKRSDGSTLLHVAARGMRHDILQRVLELCPQDINARNNMGQTPLWLAAHHNRRDNVMALLEAGADPTIADTSMRTPDMVCQAPMQRTTRLLVQQAQQAWRDSAKPQRGKRNTPQLPIRKRRGGGGFYPSKPR